MLQTLYLFSVCFLTMHPNPANHFAEFVQILEQEGIPCQVIAAKEVKDKFAHLQSTVISLDALDEDQLLQHLINQSLVITDISSDRWLNLHETLSKQYPEVKRAVYYDNPEKFVPGGYSELAEKIIDKVQYVIFANTQLAESEIKGKKTLGIGYHPLNEAKKIRELRAKREERRAEFLARNGIQELNQKIYVYIGGANETYYNLAFPHFLDLISDFEDGIVILQQHPRAKKEGNRDAKLIQDSPIVLSGLTTEKMLAIADGVFYYQTSMAAQFAFTDIPIIAQIAHETYPDVLVRAGYPSVTDREGLMKVLSGYRCGGDKSLVEKELGIDPLWRENLLKIISNLEVGSI